MNYYNEIKNELINNEVYKRVKDYSKNKNELSTYYNVGKLLIDTLLFIFILILLFMSVL